MTLKAYAKLNLTLDITGRRRDGYHTLDMLMQTVDLYDTVTLTRTERRCVGLTGGGENPAHNTAVTAAHLFFRRTKAQGGVDIKIEKGIPVRAGLGGGSSDRAAVLAGLDALFGTCAKPRDLQEIALGIGADAPFFVEGGCMRARGIGERLERVRNRCGFTYLLVKPEAGVSSAEAYRLYDESPRAAQSARRAAQALAAGRAGAFFSAAQNALFPAAQALCPDIARAIRRCRETGADFAMMSGSGSCVFAVYPSAEILSAARRALRNEFPFVHAARDVPAGSEIIRPPADAGDGFFGRR